MLPKAVKVSVIPSAKELLTVIVIVFCIVFILAIKVLATILPELTPVTFIPTKRLSTLSSVTTLEFEITPFTVCVSKVSKWFTIGSLDLVIALLSGVVNVKEKEVLEELIFLETKPLGLEILNVLAEKLTSKAVREAETMFIVTTVSKYWYTVITFCKLFLKPSVKKSPKVSLVESKFNSASISCKKVSCLWFAVKAIV